MQNDDLSEWARRLDEEDLSGSPELQAASELRANRAAIPGAPPEFKASLRARLVRRYTPARPTAAQTAWQWLLNLAAVAAVAVVVLLAIQALPGQKNPPGPAALPSDTPGAVETPVPIPAARLALNLRPENPEQPSSLLTTSLDGSEPLILDTGQIDPILQAVSPDGQTLLLIDRDSPTQSGSTPVYLAALYRIHADGSGLAKVADGYRPASATWIRGTNAFAYIGLSEQDQGDPANPNLALFRYDLDTNQSVQISEPNQHPLDLLWAHPEEGYLWSRGSISISREGGMQTTFSGYAWTAANGSESQAVNLGVSQGEPAVVSPDGERVVFTRYCYQEETGQAGCPNLVVQRLVEHSLPIRPGANDPAAREMTLHGQPFELEWSPDGERVLVLYGERDGEEFVTRYGLWNPDEDTWLPLPVTLETRTESYTIRSAAAWSADGKQILFAFSRGPVYVYDVASALLTPALENLPAELRQPLDTVFWLPGG